MPSAPESLESRASWDAPLGRMFRKGYPLTKAVWLFEATLGQEPAFPLHPEYASRIPRDLSGPVPQSAEQYHRLLEPLRRMRRPAARTRSRTQSATKAT